MSTHPVEPEPAPGADTGPPNPSHLPVEPEFAPTDAPDADEPQGRPPKL